MHRRSCLLVTRSPAGKHSLVLLRMGEIIARNMLSWLKLLINCYCCIQLVVYTIVPSTYVPNSNWVTKLHTHNIQQAIIIMYILIFIVLDKRRLTCAKLWKTFPVTSGGFNDTFCASIWILFVFSMMVAGATKICRWTEIHDNTHCTDAHLLRCSIVSIILIFFNCTFYPTLPSPPLTSS